MIDLYRLEDAWLHHQIFLISTALVNPPCMVVSSMWWTPHFVGTHMTVESLATHSSDHALSFKIWREKNTLFIYIYIYIWVNYNDLTATSLGIMVNKGNHPQMAELFRLVKYYNLPRYIYIYIYLLDPFPQNISETMGVFFPISEFPIWLVPVGSRQRKQLRACARGLAAGPGRCRSYFFGEGNCRFWQTEILKHVAYTVA